LPENEIITFILLALVGGLAGFINIVAGGGSLLTLPFLIFMGLPAPVANGTNRIAILIQNISGTIRFHKFDVIPRGIILITCIPAIAGSLVGAQIAVNIDELLFKRILAILMVVVMALMLYRPGSHIPDQPQITTRRKYFLALSFFFAGIYGGFIQAGIGLIIITLLTLTGYDLVRTNALKILIVLLYTPFALGVFVVNGQIDILKGLVLSVGNASGAWLATRIVVEKGHNFVRWLVMAAIVLFALKLFFEN
jgi:uncharacterized membrane protein YfcA